MIMNELKEVGSKGFLLHYRFFYLMKQNSLDYNGGRNHKAVVWDLLSGSVALKHENKIIIDKL